MLNNDTVQLTDEHVAAVNRRRPVIVNYDTNFGAPSIATKLAGTDIPSLVDLYFGYFDRHHIEVGSIWWCWLDGDYANYPSRLLPLWNLPGFEKWWAEGIDPVRIFAEETRQRSMEAFFSYRLNGSDSTSIEPLSKPLLKHSHPDWLIHAWDSAGNPGYWNFTVPEVRQYKFDILREIVENYDYDGIEIDFARTPILLPIGHQWEHRGHLTEFMQQLRLMTLEVETKRGRPFLLAARIPENMLACRFDGMDVETWARQHLVDIFVLGNRSFDVDLPAFRRITGSTDIKLYPCIDDHHASDGYLHPPIEVFRGVFANWRFQGAEGVQTFNFENWEPDAAKAFGIKSDYDAWPLHRQAYRELCDPVSAVYRDKVFVVQRRGGGHGTTVIPNPEDWSTPRRMCYLTNMFAQLPEKIAGGGKIDTLLTVMVADDLSGEAERIADISIRLLISDLSAEGLPASKRHEPAVIATIKAHVPKPLMNVPAVEGIEKHLAVRLNNILLEGLRPERGWLVVPAKPEQFARGDNLIGLCLTGLPEDARNKVIVEKLEVHVRYKGEGAENLD